ncbi:MAG: nucleoside-triphosphatase, partial [bacterium]
MKPLGKVKNLVIAGNPGCGKTTLVRDAVFRHRDYCSGFFTEEAREGGKRSGFAIKSLDGKEGLFASKSMVSPVRLNKYGVDLSVLEGIGVTALIKGMQEGKLILIDEIGTMETLSGLFEKTALECMASPSPVLATVRKGSGFAQSAGRLGNTAVKILERDNYAEADKEVRQWVDDWMEVLENNRVEG